jgi:hypothetical protein
MSTPNIIKLVAEENHIKFRSLVNDMLYSKLSESISDKTTNILASIFDAELVEEKDDNKKPDADGDGVPDWADKKPGKDDNEDDDDDKDEDEDDDDDKKPIKEAKKYKKDEDEDEDEEEDEEEDEDEEENKDEDEESEQNVHIDIVKGKHESDPGDEKPMGKKKGKKKLVFKKKGKR